MNAETKIASSNQKNARHYPSMMIAHIAFFEAFIKSPWIISAGLTQYYNFTIEFYSNVSFEIISPVHSNIKYIQANKDHE